MTPKIGLVSVIVLVLGTASVASDQSSLPGWRQLAQGDTSTPLRERLQEQVPADSRRRTVVPIAPPNPPTGANAGLGLPTNAQEADKLRRVQRLIEELETGRGAEPGTVKVRTDGAGGIKLEHDISKVRFNFANAGASPFTTGVPTVPGIPDASAVVTPAEVEYRVIHSHVGQEQVVGVRASGDVVATAFGAGEGPVKLQVLSADLTAQQVDAPSEELSVTVSVGGQLHEMKPGDVSRFGKIEVVVQASSNRSSKKAYLEGPPYSLRLRVRTVQ